MNLNLYFYKTGNFNKFERIRINSISLKRYPLMGLHYLYCHTYEEGTIIDTYEYPIWVTIEEDITLDFKVDIWDLSAFAKAFETVSGDPIWDSRADLNGDFTVNIFDIVKVALVFGWTG